MTAGQHDCERHGHLFLDSPECVVCKAPRPDPEPRTVGFCAHCHTAVDAEEMYDRLGKEMWHAACSLVDPSYSALKRLATGA